MSDLKILFGYIAAIISVVSYIPYITSIISSKTKPHAFTWFIWSMLSSIAFFAQVLQNAGPGAWVTGATALACLIVFSLSLFKGYKDYNLFDFFALGGALIALVIWYYSKDPTIAVILVVIIDNIGFLPTFRKCYLDPYSEVMGIYNWSTIKYIFGFFALETLSISTWLFPVSLIFFNVVFVSMVYFRRWQMSK